MTKADEERDDLSDEELEETEAEVLPEREEMQVVAPPEIGLPPPID